MPEKLTLSNREIQKLHEGLVALDGIADKDGSVLRFDLTDKMVWDVCKNRTIVERAVDTHKKARKAIGARYGVVEGMKVTPEKAADVAGFLYACEELLDATNELNGLLKLKRNDLQKAGVKVPGILVNLVPILDDK